MAVGWIQFIDLKCIDRSRNDLIEIASIGTVLRQSPCPIGSGRSPGIASPRRRRGAFRSRVPAIAGKAPHKRSSTLVLNDYVRYGDIRPNLELGLRLIPHESNGERG